MTCVKSKKSISIESKPCNTNNCELVLTCNVCLPRYGEIKSTKSIIDKQTNKCKGYGFVDYIRPEDAIKALGEMKKEQKDVQFAKQREQDPTNLYFANLPSNVDEKCLTELLKKQFSASVSSTR